MRENQLLYPSLSSKSVIPIKKQEMKILRGQYYKGKLPKTLDLY